MQRRREPEDHARDEADQEKEQQDDGIDREIHPVRLADVLRQRVEDADARIGERNAGDPAEQREHHALDEELPDHPPAARAERHAHADFLGAFGRSREQQVGDVAAGDQQDEADRTHQRPEDQFDLGRRRALVVGGNRRLDAFIGLRVVARQPRRDRCQLAARLRDRDAVGQARDDLVDPYLAALATIDRRLPERQPQVGVRGELHALRHHADDRREQIVDLDRLSQDSAIARVTGLPDAVPEDDDWRCAVEIVFRDESAAEQRLGSNQPERVCRYVRAVVALRRGALLAHVERRLGHQRHVRKASRCRPLPVEEVVIRHAQIAIARVARAQRDNAIRVRERDSAKDDGIHEREDRAVRRDSEGERDDRNSCHQAPLVEHARGEADVFENAHGSGCSALDFWALGSRLWALGSGLWAFGSGLPALDSRLSQSRPPTIW